MRILLSLFFAILFLSGLGGCSSSSSSAPTAEHEVKPDTSDMQSVLRKKNDDISVVDSLPKMGITHVIHGNPRKIIFRNDSIVEFDIPANSPYLFDEMEMMKTNEFYLPVYKVKSDENTAELRNMAIAPGDRSRFADFQIRYMETLTECFKDSKEYSVVVYNLRSFSDVTGGSVIGCRGTAYVFNRFGQIIKKFEHLDVEIGSPVLTDDGRYFGFKYGSIFEDDHKLLSPGYRIYDVQSGELIFEEKVRYQDYLGSIVSPHPQLLKLRISTNDGTGKLIYINPSRRIYYSTGKENVFTNNPDFGKTHRFSRYEEEGMVFQNLKTKDKLLYTFDTLYFKKEF